MGRNRPKKQPARGRKKPEPEMRAEYRLDYAKSKPNRFANRMAEGWSVEIRRER